MPLANAPFVPYIMYVTVISCVQFYCGRAIFHLDSLYGAVSTEVDKVTCLRDDWDLRRSTEHMKSPNASFGVESKLAIHQTPSQRILEVGAGTGGMTNQILAILHQIKERTGGTAFSEYLYTDVSSAYFDKARERFGNDTDRMSFKILDVDQDTNR